MRILFIDQSGSLGGAELQLLDIAPHFRQSCQVTLLSDGPFRERLERRGVATSVAPLPASVAGVRRESGGAALAKAAPGLAAVAVKIALRARAFDLIYANTQKALVVGAAAAAMARRPLVWHLHDILSAEHFGSGNRRLSVLLANQFAKRVIANSQASAEAFIAAGGRRNRVAVVPNGVDAAPFDAVTPEQIRRLRESLRLPPEAPLIGMFGRLARWKGQHVLLEALTRMPDAHALLVGAPLFGEEAYDDELRRLVAAHGLSDRTHFLGFRDDIPALMRLVSVVVHASTSPEPFGRVLVEGMLAGRPVVATRGGGPDEIIEDGRSGLLVPAGDPEALADILRPLLSDRKRRDLLAQAGRERALRLFSLPAMLSSLERELSYARS